MTKQFTVNVKGKPTTFESPHETLDDAIEALKASGNRSEFARDLVEKHERFGLSDSQAAWVHKLSLGNDRPQPLELGIKGIAAAIRVMPGRRPKLTLADGLVATVNSEKSKNPGHVTLTDGGPWGESVYFARIDDEGTVWPGRDYTDTITQALVAWSNANPQKETNDDLDEDLPF